MASIHSSIPNTPSYDDLNTKLDSSNRNMFHIKEQQQQLKRLQQMAQQQLHEMEQIRGQYSQMSFASNPNGPDYENVTDVQQDVSALMNRMKSLSDFIHGQNELASMLGEDKGDILEEQLTLQRKLSELKNKKQQMANLVNELQNMNDEVKQKYQDETPTRNVPIEYERIVPIELVASSRGGATQSTASNSNSRYAVAPTIISKPQEHQQPPPTIDDDDDEEDDDDEQGAAGVNDDILSDKISEINAMKNQLNRLKEMMNTVKLIEMKNGDLDPEDESGKSSRSQSHFEAAAAVPSAPTSNQPQELHYENIPIHQTHQPFNKTTSIPVVVAEQPQRDVEVEMEERVRTLHSMTQDLRLQAVTLAAERDRLKDIKNEITRRNEGATAAPTPSSGAIDKNITKRDVRSVINNDNQQDHSDILLKSEYEAKKKEFEKLVEKLDAGTTATTEQLEKPNDVIFYPENWRRGQQNVSSTSSLRSGHGGRQSEPLTKPNLTSSQQTQGKDSADSGAADVLGMSADAGSLQSGSSRGFSVPPPMRTIGARDASMFIIKKKYIYFYEYKPLKIFLHFSRCMEKNITRNISYIIYKSSKCCF